MSEYFCSSDLFLKFQTKLNHSTTDGTLKYMTSSAILPPEFTHDMSTISVTWSDSTVYEFLSLHLRDGYRCSECFDGSILQSVLNLYHDVPSGIEPKEVWTCGNELNIKWEDDHLSSFNRDRFVHMHSFQMQLICTTIEQVRSTIITTMHSLQTILPYGNLILK